jgi:hypothetical protein
MTNLFYGQIALSAALALAFLSFFYWFVIKPALAREIKFALFARRDELRRLAVAGTISINSFPYHYLEKRLCFRIDEVRGASLFRFLPFLTSRKGYKHHFETERFEKQASPELKALWERSTYFMFLGVLLNSPVLSCFLGALVLARLLGFVAKGLKERVIERFRLFLDIEVFPVQYA